MTQKLNNLRKAASHIRLTTAERDAMRAAIFAAPSPVRSEPSPYAFVSIFSYHARMAMAGLMLFVLAGVGTTSAAQGALPGDVLYPVKLSINEKLEKALASDEPAKADTEVRFAERRVEEAQALAAQGRLDEKTAETLAATFDTHAHNAETIALQAEEAEPGTVVQVRTKLASSVAVGSAVLKKLGRDSKNEKNQQQSDAFSARVIARADASSANAMQVRSTAAFAPAAKSAPAAEGAGGGIEMATLSVVEDPAGSAEPQGSERAAARLQKKSAETLAEAQKRFTAMPNIDIAAKARIEEEFGFAQESMSRGSTALGAKAYAEAEAHFTEVLRIAARLEALLRAEEMFDNGILKELILGEVEGVAIEAPVGTSTPASDASTTPSAAPEQLKLDIRL